MLLLDKPAGPTSHDVVSAVRRALGVRRVGHAGTLDPPASGLLVVLVGRATRLARFIAMLPKHYTGTIRFGWETVTDDGAGERAGEPDEGWRSLSRERLEAALQRVRAQPMQVPPAVSAKKVAGERAYRLSRRGAAPAMAPAAVTIHSLELAACDLAAGEAVVDVVCSTGTYVRAIARDVGRALETRAHLAALRRTAIGPWRLSDAVPLDAALSETAPRALRPMLEAVAHLPRLLLGEEDARRFSHGMKLDAMGRGDGIVAAFAGAELLGVAELEAGRYAPAVVLAA